MHLFRNSHPLARRALTALAILFLLPSTACDPRVKPIRLEIMDFDESAVDGVGLWRMDEASGDWQLVGEIPVTIDQPSGNAEFAYYELSFPDGNVMNMNSGVHRDSQDPDNLTISLFWYRTSDAGTFRATTYNTAGHSALSAGEVAL
jgi:hypothetical protein